LTLICNVWQENIFFKSTLTFCRLDFNKNVTVQEITNAVWKHTTYWNINKKKRWNSFVTVVDVRDLKIIQWGPQKCTHYHHSLEWHFPAWTKNKKTLDWWLLGTRLYRRVTAVSHTYRPTATPANIMQHQHIHQVGKKKIDKFLFQSKIMRQLFVRYRLIINDCIRGSMIRANTIE